MPVLPLPKNFYQRHPAAVAPDLLGKLVVRQVNGATLCGRIVETEAYGSDDPASHTARGMTPRNKAMFGEAGCAYIYFIHGLHYCLNVTARGDTPAGAVLIRALEPVSGVATMQKLRGRTSLPELASGPAKLTQALAIDKSLYGHDMTLPGPLFIAAEPERPAGPPLAVKATPRIGISRATDLLWRFVLVGSECLSKKQPV